MNAMLSENVLRTLSFEMKYEFVESLGSADIASNPELIGFMEADDTIAINDGGVIYTCNPINSNLQTYKRGVATTLSKKASVKVALPSLIEKIRHEGLTKASEISSLSEFEMSEVDARLDELFAEAQERGASDVHIRLTSRGMIVEFRENSFLVPHKKHNLSFEEGRKCFVHLVNKASASTGGETDYGKIINGAFEYTISSEKFRFRISFMPLSEGRAHFDVKVSEAVMRILPPVGERSIDIEEMNLPPNFVRAARRSIEQKSGAILIGGPTGSGKSTLAHAVLGCAQEGRKISTIEDPVEIVNRRFRQTEVVANGKGHSFMEVLRNMLRQDTDIVLVGELRNAEQAKVAAQVALNGHLLVSTLHIDRVSAVFSYLHLFLDLLPVQIASESFSTLWVCQRLATRLCEYCSIPFNEESDGARKDQAREVMEIHGYDTSSVRFRNTKGCPHCNSKGALGLTSRVPVIEYIELDQKCREFVEKSNITGLMAYVSNNGWESMSEHAAYLIANGYLDVETVTLEVGALTGGTLGKDVVYQKTYCQQHTSDLYLSCDVLPNINNGE